MKLFGNKIDGNPGEDGLVHDADYNSVFQELDNAVLPFMSLGGGNDQLVKSVDIAIKHQSYETSGGTPNDIVLIRTGVDVNLETELDGMQIPFKCTVSNTGAMSAQIKGTGKSPKPILFDGKPVVPSWLIVGAYYSLTYVESTGHYNIDSVSGDLLYDRKGYIRDTFYTKTYLDDKFKEVVRTANFIQGKAGYLKFSNGFIIQWDEVVVAGDSSSSPLLFPVTFPNAVINVQLTFNIPPPARHNTDGLLGVSYVTKTGYSIYNGYGRDNKPSSIFVCAIGY